MGNHPAKGLIAHFSCHNLHGFYVGKRVRGVIRLNWLKSVKSLFFVCINILFEILIGF